jgi:nucleoside-diphosphate-sugar epimerase
MQNRTIVLSGATGFLGRHFAYEVLRKGSDAWLCAITRGSDVAQARERVLRAVLEVAHAEGTRMPNGAFDRLEVVLGDVTLPFCGLDAESRRALCSRQVGSFWHFAASTEFDEQRRAFIEQQNVLGTEHALDVAREIGAARFVHLSTSYACGKHEGEIPEALHEDAGFNNPYEQSKHRSEKLVLERCSAAGMDARILRPSIVVGSSQSHEPHGAEHAFYRFLRGIYGMRHLMRQADSAPAVYADAEAPLNLVPVDTLTRDAVALLEEGFPHGPFYHLTSNQCPTVKQALDAVCDAASVPHLRISPEPIAQPSPLERMLAEGMSLYASYLQKRRQFARAYGTPPALGAHDARLWCDRWIDLHRMGRRHSDPGLPTTQEARRHE